MTNEDLAGRAARSEWVARVKVALAQVCLDKIKPAPTGAQEIAEDALGRFVRNQLDAKAREYALEVALGFIGLASLDAPTVSDADIFSRVNALWPEWLPAPA